jgi:hypothetical protein
MYTPNLADPRVIKRITKAIEFVETYIFSTPVPVAKSQINKHFGFDQIQQYLKHQLLVCEDQYYNMATGVCKKYVRNIPGLLSLKQSIGSFSLALAPELQQQLDTGQFEYTESSDRYFNPIQYQPRRIKRPLLAKNGYIYNYDIVCAAPTLFYQYAQKTCPNLKLSAIEQYLADRSSIRNNLSIQYNIPQEQIKQIITGLFQGALLSLNHNTRIYHLLNGNYDLIRRLQGDPYLCNLRNDIKSMWKIITPCLKQTLNKTRITARDKSSLYRSLEKEVMSVIKKELKKTGNQFLLEHDGWTCRDVVDINWLRSSVRSSTGYVIEIDWEIYE